MAVQSVPDEPPEQLALFEGKPVVAFEGSIGNLGGFPMGEELHLDDEVEVKFIGRVVKAGGHSQPRGITRYHTISADADSLKIKKL
jgi:hypothetical protein